MNSSSMVFAARMSVALTVYLPIWRHHSPSESNTIYNIFF